MLQAEDARLRLLCDIQCLVSETLSDNLIKGQVNNLTFYDDSRPGVPSKLSIYVRAQGRDPIITTIN